MGPASAGVRPNEYVLRHSACIASRAWPSAIPTPVTILPAEHDASIVTRTASVVTYGTLQEVSAPRRLERASTDTLCKDCSLPFEQAQMCHAPLALESKSNNPQTAIRATASQSWARFVDCALMNVNRTNLERRGEACEARCRPLPCCYTVIRAQRRLTPTPRGLASALTSRSRSHDQAPLMAERRPSPSLADGSHLNWHSASRSHNRPASQPARWPVIIRSRRPHEHATVLARRCARDALEKPGSALKDQSALAICTYPGHPIARHSNCVGLSDRKVGGRRSDLVAFDLPHCLGVELLLYCLVLLSQSLAEASSR